MAFNTPVFVVFFVVVLMLYALMPKRYKWIWLLAASWFFYLYASAKFFIFVLLTALAGAFRLVFGLKRTARRFAGQTGADKAREKAEADGPPRPRRKRQGKFFEKDEGVYVDFEEIN